MKSEFLKTYLGSKAAVLVTVILVAVIVVYFVVFKKKKENTTVVDFEIDKITVDPEKVTIDSEQAKGIARSLFDEMDGVNWTGSTEAIEYAVKKIRTVEDAKLVYKAFGERDGDDLVSWLNSEVHYQTLHFGTELDKLLDLMYKVRGRENS